MNYSTKLRSELSAQTAELVQASKEIMNLKSELLSLKELQAHASPNRFRPEMNHGLSEITPIKETIPDSANREYTHTASDENVGIEYQLQLEVKEKI